MVKLLSDIINTPTTVLGAMSRVLCRKVIQEGYLHEAPQQRPQRWIRLCAIVCL